MESRSWAGRGQTLGILPLWCSWHGDHGIIWLPQRHQEFCCKQECSLPSTYTLTFLPPLPPLRRGVKLKECDGNGNWQPAAWKKGRVIAERAYDLLHLLPGLFLGMGGWKRLSHSLSCRRPSCTEGACQPGLRAIQDRNCPTAGSSLGTWLIASTPSPFLCLLAHYCPKQRKGYQQQPSARKSQAVSFKWVFQVLQNWFPSALMKITHTRYHFIGYPFVRKNSGKLLIDFVDILLASSYNLYWQI